MKKILLILLAATLARALVAMEIGPKTFAAPPASPVEVKIDNFSFVPASITVAAGTVVRWVNHDDIPHNVVSTDKTFKSKVMDTGEEFTYTFDKPGTYIYFCSIHPKMTGKVIVQ